MTSLANTALRSIMKQAKDTAAARFNTDYFLGAIEAIEKYFDTDADLAKEAHETVHELRRRNGVQSGLNGAS